MALTGGSFSSGTTAIATNAAGQAVFSNLVTNSIGTYTLSLSAAGVASTSSNPFKVNVDAPTLSFTVQPVNANSGITMRTVTVRAADKYGNVVPGLTVNLSLSSGTLKGTATATTTAAGLASFSGLPSCPPGTGYSLTATATGVTAVKSNAFNILALPASRLAFLSLPTSPTAGATFSPMTVQVLDVNSNPVSGTPVTISMPSGTLAGTFSAVTDLSGSRPSARFGQNRRHVYAQGGLVRRQVRHQVRSRLPRHRSPPFPSSQSRPTSASARRCAPSRFERPISMATPSRACRSILP